MKKQHKKKKKLKSYFLAAGARDAKILLEPIGLVMFRFLKHIPITPNMYTTLHIIVSILIGYLFTIGDQRWLVVGALLIQFNRILDGIDGATARYKKQCSLKGKYIDLLSHAWAAPVYIIGISIYAFKQTGNTTLLFLGLSATFFELIIYITKLSHIRVSGKPYLDPTKLGTDSWLLNKIKYPVLINFDNVIYYLILIGAIINNVSWIIYMLAVALPIKWLFQFWLLSYFEEDKDNDFF